MKLLSLILLTVFTLPTLAMSTEKNSTDDLFVVLTSEDAETQMMAMVLATQSANQNVNVRILLCSSAGKLALKDSESPNFKPADRSPKQLLNGLIESGAKVEVCGIFLPNRDATEADLIEGIGLASPPEVAEYMKRDSVRYFTF